MTNMISLNPASAAELQQTKVPEYAEVTSAANKLDIELGNAIATADVYTSNAQAFFPINDIYEAIEAAKLEAIEASRIGIGTVRTGDPGSSVSVEIDREQGSQSLNFIIPSGETGPQGQQGEVGPQGPNSIAGYTFQMNNPTPGDLVIFDGSYWVNEPKQNISDGGNF